MSALWQNRYSVGVGKDMIVTDEQLAAAEYLLSEDYLPLLKQAIAARLTAATNHEARHLRALDLIDAIEEIS